MILIGVIFFLHYSSVAAPLGLNYWTSKSVYTGINVTPVWTSKSFFENQFGWAASLALGFQFS